MTLVLTTRKTIGKISAGGGFSRLSKLTQVPKVEPDSLSGTLTVKQYLNKDKSGGNNCSGLGNRVNKCGRNKVKFVKFSHLPKTYNNLSKVRRCSTESVTSNEEELLESLAVNAIDTHTPDEDSLDFYSAIESIEAAMSKAQATDSKEAKVVKTVNEEPNGIAPFPPVEIGEIDKHRHLNEEAEQNSKNQNQHEVHPDYLKRLKLERKALAEKNREMRLKKKLLMQKRAAAAAAAAKAKMKEVREDFFFPEPIPAPQPSRPREIGPKTMKTILGFRYSQAIEEYYRAKLKDIGKFVTYLNAIEEDDIKEEVVNGWYVRTMGSQVLNLRANTLPSCNPVEIRLRRQQARLRQREHSKCLLNLHRTLSRESVASRVLLRSRESMSVLNSIEEGQESDTSPDTSDNVILTGRRTRKDSDHSIITLASPSKLSVHSGDEYYSAVPKPAAKAMSLRLPPIVSEET